MKKALIIFILVLSAMICCGAQAFAEDDGYWVDMPEQATVGLNESITIEFLTPPSASILNGKAPQLTCNNPDALTITYRTITKHTSDTSYWSFCFRMTEKGVFTLTFSVPDTYSYDVCVTVTDCAVSAHAGSDAYVLQIGETVPTNIELVGGIRYHSPVVTINNSELVSFSEDFKTFTALRPGHASASIRCGNEGIGAFDILVVDESNNVQLSTKYENCVVGMANDLTVITENGSKVCTYIEITEGADLAYLHRDLVNVCIRPQAAGWVTLTAYGTDGSTDSVRLRIYDMPTSMDVTLSLDTVAAGENLSVSAVYTPEDTWAPLEMGFVSQHPNAEGLEGPVAVEKDGVVTGIIPGTCRLAVWTAGHHQEFDITITDSEQALVFERPEPTFDWREGFQLSIHDKTGKIYPATYSARGMYISVTEDGFLSASQANAYGTVVVELENGLTYEMKVQSVEYPAYLTPEASIISLPADLDLEMCWVSADVYVTRNDLILCSGDESIVRVDNWRLYPQKKGIATLTVWSRYCDTSCTVLVEVTDPIGRLYVNGRPEGVMIDIPCDVTVPLPTVTDYLGNPVSVTWTKAYESIGHGNPKNYNITMVGSSSVKANWPDGYAELVATSATGATYKLSVFPYGRASKCKFANNEYTITVGSWTQVNFMPVYDYGSSYNQLTYRDVTFTITGNTNSVLLTRSHGMAHSQDESGGYTGYTSDDHHGMSYSQGSTSGETGVNTQTVIIGETNIASIDVHPDYFVFTGLRPGTVTLTAKLWNGYIATTVIHVIMPDACAQGHNPVWRVEREPTADRDGIRQLCCSRCSLVFEEEAIPCTGVLGFALNDIYVTTEGAGQLASLGTNMNGDYKLSFTWRSSDPEIAEVLADTVVGLKPGTTEITVTRGDCIPATCRIHVLAPRVLELPASLQVIEDGAFEGVAATCVRIPDQVTEIGSRAFAECPYLMEVSIPASVTSIATDAFDGSPWVIIVCNPDSYAAAWAEAHFFSGGN